jgi:hypothetical protein
VEKPFERSDPSFLDAVAGDPGPADAMGPGDFFGTSPVGMRTAGAKDTSARQIDGRRHFPGQPDGKRLFHLDPLSMHENESLSQDAAVIRIKNR